MAQCPTARGIAADAIAAAAQAFPLLEPISLDLTALEPRDARLALAIHRTVMQRWLTLEHLLDVYLRKPLRQNEPALQGVLLTAAAQLVFMERLPVHAVVDEAVKLGRAMVRPQAAGLVNAVLRRLSEQVEQPVRGKPWTPAADRLPLEDGYVVLRESLLPDPVRFESHLAIATSHPLALVQRWASRFGQPTTTELAFHGIVTPPTILAVEETFPSDPAAAADQWSRHEMPGYLLWQGSHEAMIRFLAEHPARRVQDPASTLPVRSTAGLPLRLIVDYCAGRGTKTRQLALLHPQARILATDVAPRRLADLRQALADRANVSVLEIFRLTRAAAGEGADLLLLDVPCSNTAVLARRPEARYRFNEATLRELVALQRRIVERAATLLRPGGSILYSTCSLEDAENQEQTRWMLERFGATLVSEKLTLPAGHSASYHDGSYHALLRLP